MNTSLLQKSLDAIRRGVGNSHTRCVVVLGSGWSEAAEGYDRLAEMPYSEIPLLGQPTVQGHAGRLLRVRNGSGESLVFCGRRHWYEGYGWEPVAIPVFTALGMGATHVLLTNAAGGIRQDLEPGCVMVVTDHMNLMGTSPLAGPHDRIWGPRFPDMTSVYDGHANRLLSECLREAGQDFSNGVYAAVAGPAYETPAEVRALRQLGADAVGMSTVPEAALARAAGLRVAALSVIANRAAGLEPGTGLSHAEVLRTAGDTSPRTARAVSLFLTRIQDAPGSVSE